MRKLISCLLLTPLFFLACEKVEVPILTISEELIEFSADAGSRTITLSSTDSWSASASDWCAVTPQSGSGGNEIQVEISVQKNESDVDRECTITFSSGELTRALKVAQLANANVVLPEQDYNVSSEAQQLEVVVKANVEYKVEIDVDWITQVSTKAEDTAVMLFDIECNETPEARTGTINIIDEQSADIITVKVNQVQQDAIFVSMREFMLSCEEHTLELEVQTNVELEVVIPDDAKSWVEYVDTRALEDKVVTLYVAANPESEARDCEIVVKKRGEDFSESVFIYQEENLGAILEMTEYEVSCEEQDLQIQILANTSLNIEIDAACQDWLSVAETRAMSEQMITLLIKENTSYDVREGKVYVRVEDKEALITITITQLGNEALFVSEESFNIGKEGGNIEVVVSATMEYEVEILDSWITENVTRALDENTHSFTISANADVQGRSGHIVFKSLTTKHEATVAVNQNGAGGYIWYNGIQASSSVPGQGTESDPYIIHTANDLQWLIEQANYGDIEYFIENDYDKSRTLKTIGKYYKLTHDIEIDSQADVVDGAGNVVEARCWTPIGMGNGTVNSPIFRTFAGTFDGGGHTITGKMVPGHELTESDDLHFGLFGHCATIDSSNNSQGHTPTIKNLNMAVEVSLHGGYKVYESINVGTLVGCASGVNVINCKNSGNVTVSGTATNKWSHGYLRIGGLVGYSTSIVTIENCENCGVVDATGFSSYDNGNEHDSWNTYVGGVAGEIHDVTIKNVVNKGKIYGSSTQTVHTGGVVGYIVMVAADGVYNYAEVAGGDDFFVLANVGGVFGSVLCGNYGSATINDCHNTAKVKCGTFKPYTSTHYFVGGLIAHTQSLMYITNCSNSGEVYSSDSVTPDSYSSYEGAIGGLIGANYCDVSNCTNSGTVSATLGTSVFDIGGIAGSSMPGDKYGLSNCTNTGDVNIHGQSGSSSIYMYIGGCVGDNSDRIYDCVNKGAITVTGNPDYLRMGGIAGQSYYVYDYTIGKKLPDIKNCVNEGKVTAAPGKTEVVVAGIVGHGYYTQNCVNKADVTGADAYGQTYTAGIDGWAENSHVIDGCTNHGTITGGISTGSFGSYTGGIVGCLKYYSRIFNGCANTGLIVQPNLNSSNTYAGTIAGYVDTKYCTGDQIPTVCSCSQDTSNSALPMIGGGETALTQNPDCTSH